jgi:hypothetical protein
MTSDVKTAPLILVDARWRQRAEGQETKVCPGDDNDYLDAVVLKRRATMIHSHKCGNPACSSRVRRVRHFATLDELREHAAETTVTRRGNAATAFLLVLLASLCATPAGAQVRYQDTEGTTHWVNSLDEVPQPYRAGAVGSRVAPPTQPSQPSGVDWAKKAREVDRERDAETKRLDEETNGSREIRACQAAVLSILKSPGTARFVSGYYVPSAKFSPNQLAVVGEVDAHNSFGGFLRSDYGCKMDGTKVWDASVFTRK